MPTRKTLFGTGIIFVAVLALWMWALPTSSRALPPRRTPTAVPNQEEHADALPEGAFIQVSLAESGQGLWAGVQWQDVYGDWHDVQNWQGPLSQGGAQRWYVAPKDYGTGPFRWLVRSGQGGDILGTSVSFFLPGAAQQVLVVSVSLGE
jgi:hypothetical protein